MEDIQLAAKTISFFRRKEKIKSRSSWSEWRDIVCQYYQKDHHLSRLLMELNKGVVASKKINQQEEIISELIALESVETQQHRFLLLLYYKILLNRKEMITASSFHQMFQGFFSQSDNLEADREIEEIIQKFSEKRIIESIAIHGTVQFLFFDFIIRLLYFQLHLSLGYSDFFYTLIQFLVIPALLFSILIWRDKKIQSLIKFMLQKLEVNAPQIKTQINPWQILNLIGIAFTGAWFAEIYFKEGFLLFFIVYTAYLLVILFLFSKKKPQESELYIFSQQYIKRNENTDLKSDENDIEIIEMEVSLKSMNGRMEAFVLEAALFGALSFSAYLQISSSQFIKENSFYELIKQLNHLFTQFLHPNASQNFSLQIMDEKSMIFSIIAILTLMCSAFFLAVIATRLTFSDLANLIDKKIQISKDLNEKEEHWLQQHKNASQSFTKKISALIKGGLRNLEQAQPIMEYMRFFRTLGIFTFFLVLVVSGLLISKELSLLIICIGILTYIFFNQTFLLRSFQNSYSWVQEFYFEVSPFIFTVLSFTLVFGILLRSLFPGTILSDLIPFIGFSFGFLHLMISLILPEKIDEDEVNHFNDFKENRLLQIIPAKIFKLSTALIILGFILKVMHWPFAGVNLIIGVVLFNLFVIIGRKINHNSRALHWIFSIALSMTPIGFLFGIQSWPGLNICRIAALGSIPVLLYILFRYKNQIKSPFRSISIFFIILTLLTQSFVVRQAIMNLSFNPTVLSNNQNYVYYELKLTTQMSDGGWSDAKKNRELDSLHRYLRLADSAFTTKILPTPNAYNFLAWHAYENYQDSISLNYALQWSIRSIQKVPNQMDYLDTYLRLLYKLKQFESFKKEFTSISQSFGKESDRETYLELQKLYNQLDSNSAPPK
jgi:hypothetical protein